MSLAGLKKMVEKHEEKNEKTKSGDFIKVRYFSLKNDGEESIVRPLISGVVGEDGSDLIVKEVHQIKVNEDDRFGTAVLCKGKDCELCKVGNKPKLKMWLPLIVEKGVGEDNDADVLVWERGIADIKKWMGLIASHGELNGRTWRIKRNGKAGSVDTFYEVSPNPVLTEFEGDIPQFSERDIISPNSYFCLDLNKEQMKKAIDCNFTRPYKEEKTEEKEEEKEGQVRKDIDAEDIEVPF